MVVEGTLFRAENWAFRVCMRGKDTADLFHHDEPERREKSTGAKAQILVGPFAARLKSCPDTKHQSGDPGKLALSGVGSIHLRKITWKFN
jgi:hypothetical protein